MTLRKHHTPSPSRGCDETTEGVLSILPVACRGICSMHIRYAWSFASPLIVLGNMMTRAIMLVLHLSTRTFAAIFLLLIRRVAMPLVAACNVV